MTHWYGWLALLFAVSHALWDLYAIAVNAWLRARGEIRRDDNTENAIFWIAVWTTAAVAMVLA